MSKALKILVVGGGGREHALAWAIDKSPRCGELFVAPGNAGTPGQRVPVAATDIESLVAFSVERGIDLVVVGPESALAAGLVDALADKGIAAFGPSRSAARIESSKAWAREFCESVGILGPRAASFTDADEAIGWANGLRGRVVVKADGLASGKGVELPDSPEATAAAIRAACALGRVVLEERLEGEEVSVLAFTDGVTVSVMPPAQDHKRIFEGDRGPNTGGMGAYAPAPVCPPALRDEIAKTVIQPAVDGLAGRGHPFVGVLYAGIMLTDSGPRVLEFNARFGDPETQAILPLLRTDLVEILLACTEQCLASIPVEWSDRSAVAVVLAVAGYPANPRTGDEIEIRSASPDDTLLFHAGTDVVNGKVVTTGGRVVSVVGVGHTFVQARAAAYVAVPPITFAGRQFRRDIGWRAIARTSGGYAASGVNIDAGTEAVSRMKAAVEATHTAAVVAGVGSFGGVLDLSMASALQHPLLVASTDGVGTKVMVGVAAGNTSGLGEDLVNHCINDILVQNARPIAFLDYVAAAQLDPAIVAEIVTSMARACAAAGCVLLGGETAEMPGVYHDGHLDIAGTIIGLADRARLLPRTDVEVGDVIIGLASSGPHTNGYSLLRKIFAGVPYDASPEPLSVPLGEALLRPHRNYLPVLRALLDADPSPVKAMAHITGGGLIDNPPRVLPAGCGAAIRTGSWPVPPLFQLVRDASGLDPIELHRTLNMGIGMILVVGRASVAEVQAAIPEESWVIGEIVAGHREVTLL